MSLAARFVLKSLERLSVGRLTVRLPDSQVRVFGKAEAAPNAEIDVRDWRFFRRVLVDGDMGFAEAYMEGFCDSPDLPSLIRLLLANEQTLGNITRTNFFHGLLLKLLHRRHENTREGSKKNIHAHYDLGNEFYGLWLDPSMTYSSALFSSADQSLEEAQHQKYRRVAELAGVREGESVLEIGCGWGGFAETAAKDFGAAVYGITLSKEQLHYAEQRLAAQGLGNLATLHLEDYRDTKGAFDHVASIEMIEAVGEAHWPTYFKAVHDRLKPGGTASIQAITIDENDFEAYRNGPDFIQRFIFPGGMLPSVAAMQRHAGAAGLVLRSELSFGDSYAATLAAWRQRFLEAWPAIEAQGFDAAFKRLWTYYLAYCEAGFRAGKVDVGLFTLQHAQPAGTGSGNR
jgi:cyclopropane-fatty-acyl-phospholipid synthase